MNVLTADQFSPADLTKLFARADMMRRLSDDKLSRLELASKHQDKQVCSLFYEPSTRTRISFETAALKLGMGVVSTENASEFSSAAKGETIEDTIRVLNGYNFSVVIIRHPVTGEVAKAASVSQVPIINAGDGKGDARLGGLRLQQRLEKNKRSFLFVERAEKKYARGLGQRRGREFRSSTEKFALQIVRHHADFAEQLCRFVGLEVSDARTDVHRQRGPLEPFQLRRVCDVVRHHPM